MGAFLQFLLVLWLASTTSTVDVAAVGEGACPVLGIDGVEAGSARGRLEQAKLAKIPAELEGTAAEEEEEQDDDEAGGSVSSLGSSRCSGFAPVVPPGHRHPRRSVARLGARAPPVS